MEPGQPAPAGHQHDISFLTAIWADRPWLLIWGVRFGRSTVSPVAASTSPSPKRKVSSRASRAAAADIIDPPVPILDQGIAARQRPFGMGEPRRSATRRPASRPPGGASRRAGRGAARRRRGRARPAPGRAGRARPAAGARRDRRAAAAAARAGPRARASGGAGPGAARPTRSAVRRAQRSARPPSSRTWPSSSARTGTAISAAAVGVGARRSAAKSVKRGVGLVADRRDGRDSRAGDGAHHRLLVERPQILDRAAAARDDEQIGRRRQRVEAGDRGGDLLGGALALDRDRPQDDVGREAVLEPVDDVADHRPGRRGDDADRPRREGQGPFSAPRRTAPRRPAPGAACRAGPSARPARPAPAARPRSGSASAPDRW